MGLKNITTVGTEVCSPQRGGQREDRAWTYCVDELRAARAVCQGTTALRDLLLSRALRGGCTALAQAEGCEMSQTLHLLTRTGVCCCGWQLKGLRPGLVPSCLFTMKPKAKEQPSLISGDGDPTSHLTAG